LAGCQAAAFDPERTFAVSEAVAFRHYEERSDEAILLLLAALDCFAALAMAA
jgi:hypothetical protein